LREHGAEGFGGVEDFEAYGLFVDDEDATHLARQGMEDTGELPETKLRAIEYVELVGLHWAA
jgi:hypothetical protein